MNQQLVIHYFCVLQKIWVVGLFVLLLVACGGAAETAVVPTPTVSPQVKHGEQVFIRECGACHSFSADTIIVGPPLAGIGTRAAERVEGQDAQTYLLASIMRPSAYLVEGFEDKMPANFGKKLTGEEIDAIVAYLLTVK